MNGFWSNVDQDQAFANLRPVFSELRKAFGTEGERLQSPDRHTLILDLSNADIDVLAFDAAIASKKLTALTQAKVLSKIGSTSFNHSKRHNDNKASNAMTICNEMPASPLEDD